MNGKEGHPREPGPDRGEPARPRDPSPPAPGAGEMTPAELRSVTGGGTNDISCWLCSGTGKCVNCGGTGQVMGDACYACGGSGNCRRCGGDGLADSDDYY